MLGNLFSNIRAVDFWLVRDEIVGFDFLGLKVKLVSVCKTIVVVARLKFLYKI